MLFTNKKQRATWLFRFFFISILGVLFHFTYEWSSYSPLVSLFSATNESTWEHLKLLFFPMIFLPIIEAFSGYHTSNFLYSRTGGIIYGMILIVVTFFTLFGILGRSFDFLNIAIYFFAVIFALWIENRYSKKEPRFTSFESIIILAFLVMAFFFFTAYPPDIGLFDGTQFSSTSSGQ